VNGGKYGILGAAKENMALRIQGWKYLCHAKQLNRTKPCVHQTLCLSNSTVGIGKTMVIPFSRRTDIPVCSLEPQSGLMSAQRGMNFATKVNYTNLR
jgi:hypothetical protein